MTRLALLLLALSAAAADAGPAQGPSPWKITFATSAGTDHGSGVIVSTRDTELMVTPELVLRSAKYSEHGGPLKYSSDKPRPLLLHQRDALAALLPALPPSNTYSISPSVDDEGWSTESLTVERGGQTLHYQLVRGSQHPPVPEPISRLLEALAALSQDR